MRLLVRVYVDISVQFHQVDKQRVQPQVVAAKSAKVVLFWYHNLLDIDGVIFSHGVQT
jgi:hypothetical protein